MNKLTSISVIIAFAFLTLNCKAENKTGKLVNERNNLVIEYDSIKAKLDFKSWAVFNDVENLMNIHDAIIEKDLLIIEELDFLQSDYEKLENANTKLESEYKKADSALDEMKQWFEWGLYAAGAAAFLILLFFILFIVYAVKVGRLKKHLKKTEKLHSEYQERLENAEKIESEKIVIAELEAQYIKSIENNKNQFEEEKKLLNGQIYEAKNENESLKQVIQVLQTETQELKESVKNTSNQEVEALNENINKLNQLLSTKDAELEQLRTERIDNINVLNNEIEAYKAKIEDINQKLEAKDKECDKNDSDIIENLKQSKASLADEISSLRRTLEEEKVYSQELRTQIDSLNKEIVGLRDSASQSDVKQVSNKGDNFNDNISTDLLNENAVLKEQIDGYKKILDEELEFRKDILKLIDDLKKQ